MNRREIERRLGGELRRTTPDCLERVKTAYVPEDGIPAEAFMPRRRKRRGFAAAMACLLVFCIGMGSYGYYLSPRAYVYVEGSANIALGVNVSGRVVKVEAMDEASRAMAKELSGRRRTVDEAVSLLLDRMLEQGDGSAVVTVTGGNGAQETKLEERLISQASNRTENRVMVQRADQSVVSEAEEQDISAGRLLLLQKIREADPSANESELSAMTLEDLLDRLDDLDGELDDRTEDLLEDAADREEDRLDEEDEKEERDREKEEEKEEREEEREEREREREEEKEERERDKEDEDEEKDEEKEEKDEEKEERQRDKEEEKQKDSQDDDSDWDEDDDEEDDDD